MAQRDRAKDVSELRRPIQRQQSLSQSMPARRPLTPTHPHGHVLVRPDEALGLLRISKNASTESKTRLGCERWVSFGDYDGPVVAFLREPVSRFISGIPETMLRMTHYVVSDSTRLDRVEVPEDVYSELISIAGEPVGEVVELFLELIEYAYFDAHHEPQSAFFTDRSQRLRIDPLLYLTESFDQAVSQIEKRTDQQVASPAWGRTPGKQHCS